MTLSWTIQQKKANKISGITAIQADITPTTTNAGPRELFLYCSNSSPSRTNGNAAKIVNELAIQPPDHTCHVSHCMCTTLTRV